VVALFAREAVEDLETDLAAGGDREELATATERMGMDFQIATRFTSWVAVSCVHTGKGDEPRRHQRMPHELPNGVSAEGLGLRVPAAIVEAFPASPRDLEPAPSASRPGWAAVSVRYRRAIAWTLLVFVFLILPWIFVLLRRC
jgi:Ca-activated chloride channel family protein